MISGQERLACMDDAARLREPSAYDYQSHCQRFICTEQLPASRPLSALSPGSCSVTAEQLAHEFSLGIAIVEEQLQQLREQGLVMNLQQTSG